MHTTHDTHHDTRLEDRPETVADLLPIADAALGPLVAKTVGKRRFAVLATSSPAGRPHSAGILYQVAGRQLWISTDRSSRKARNVVADPRVALTVPIRRLPFGPPASVLLQATASVIAVDDPEVVRLARSGALKRVTSHGELDLPDGCFLRLDLPRRVPTYGLGMSLYSLARNPLDAARVAEVTWI